MDGSASAATVPTLPGDDVTLINRLFLSACSLTIAASMMSGCDDASDTDSDATGESEEWYAVGTAVYGAEGTLAYAKLLESLDLNGENVSLDDAYEYNGQADIFVYNEVVFVADGDSPTVTRFEVTTSGELVEGESVSFQNYGLPSASFWNNTFISDTKAYMRNGAEEYVIWNPASMEILGTVEIPALEEREGLVGRAALSDRGTRVANGKLFQPMYWSDADYAHRSDDSQIYVFDTETDMFETALDADCPGLDYATVGPGGDLFFSNWTGGAGAALLLDDADTCVVQVDPAALTAEVAFSIADVADGRQGAAAQYVGDDTFVMSVFHDENVDLDDYNSPNTLIATANWNLWSYNIQTEEAEQLDDIVSNSGAIYWASVEDNTYVMVPAADYSATTAYRVTPGAATRDVVFDIAGWAIRLFRVL